MMNTLLIVDDDLQTRFMLMRLCKRRFHSAFTAAAPADATRILRENPITHILCDYHLGDGVPNGIELIVRWRRQYPLIQRVILYSGSILSNLHIPGEVDLFFEKGDDPLRILEALTA